MWFRQKENELSDRETSIKWGMRGKRKNELRERESKWERNSDSMETKREEWDLEKVLNEREILWWVRGKFVI